MKLKVRAEDFQVQEILRWDEDPKGEWTLYRVQKKGMTTSEAIERIRASLENESVEISYAGPKDRQAETTQTIALRGWEIRGRVPGLTIKKIGKSASGLSAKDLIGHRYEIVARDLSHEAASWAQELAPKLSELGLPNYFDDQRFGSMRAGQGFPARDLLLEDFEQALMRIMGLPGKFDAPEEVSRKAVIRKYWGQWPEMAARVRGARAQSLIDDLAKHPGDYLGALQRMPDALRASELMAYQAFLWNDAVARIVQKRLPPGALMQADSICDRHVFWKDPRYEAQLEAMSYFKAASVPLVDSETRPKDDLIRRALNDSLEAEGLKWVCFKMRQLPKAFFKEVERPLVLLPKNMTVGAIEEDEEHRGRYKLRLGFELPTGSYATLVIKRLFQSYRFDNEHVLPRDWHRAIRFDRSGEVILEAVKKPRVSKDKSLDENKEAAPERPHEKVQNKKPRLRRERDVKALEAESDKAIEGVGPGDAKPKVEDGAKARESQVKPDKPRPKRQRFKESEAVESKAPRRRGLKAKKSKDLADAKPNFPWATPKGAEDESKSATRVEEAREPRDAEAETATKEAKLREWRKLKPKTKDKGYPKKFRRKLEEAKGVESPKKADPKGPKKASKKKKDPKRGAKRRRRGDQPKSGGAEAPPAKTEAGPAESGAGEAGAQS